MSIESIMPFNYFILCCPFLLLPPIFPNIRVFSNKSDLCIRWPKYWSFNFSISPYSEYSGLISFRMDWLDHLAVQGILNSLLQHHNWEASIALQNEWLGCFMPQFSFFVCLFVWCGSFFFKVFVEFVILLLLFYVSVFWPWGIWDPKSPFKDRTHAPLH